MMKMKGMNLLMNKMMKEMMGVIPPPPKFKPTTKEAITIQKLVDLLVETLGERGALISGMLPHFVYYAEKRPKEAKKAILKIREIMNEYNNNR